MVASLSIFVAWGKLTRNGDEISFHPLIDHMHDVAACFVALTQSRAIRRALTRAAGRELDAVDIARLAVLVFLHDIGKANAGFQSRRWDSGSRPHKNWPISPNGHGPEGWALSTGNIGPLADAILAALPLDQFAEWGANAFENLLRASISHHGRPLGDNPAKQSDEIWQAVHANDGTVLYDPAATVAAMGHEILRVFPLAFTVGAQPLPDTPAFVHLFAGLVQLADWLGSDTRAGFFEYSAAGEDRSLTAPQRASYAVRAIGLVADPLRDVLLRSPPTFAAAFNVDGPRPMQTAVIGPAAPLVILEAETGSGKTEAALWRFAHLFQNGAVDSLYFAVPTRVAATQLCDRIRDFVKRIWPVDPPVVVRALPGDEAADGNEKISLPDFQVQWPDYPADVVAHQRWVAEAPKRFLAATIAIGTIDQALLGALRVRHAHLRHALLSRSLLVVDEVHASDAYMTVLLEHLLKAHLHVGGQALLLSATLGAVARTRYLNIGRSGKPAALPALAEAASIAYPALSYRHAGVAQLDEVEGNPVHKTVHWATLDAIDEPERISALALEAAVKGARVLVIRNTVEAAVATLRAIEVAQADAGQDYLFKVNGVSTLHHSRFSRQDRQLLNEQVSLQFGKKRNASGGCILVGTQTLEQSLDIDADFLITDLCPMDVLLQRLGRLHRHERDDSARPPDYRLARAWVLTPAGGDLTPLLTRTRNGLGRRHDGGGVYPDLRMLEATRRLIRAQASRVIPLENRILVEHATHPEALLQIETLGEGWQKIGQAIEGDTCAQRGQGHNHVIMYDAPFDQAGMPDSEQKIATRLGAADRLIEFPEPLPIGPFGQPVSQLALRFHQLPQDSDPEKPPSDIAPLFDGGFEFSLQTTRYRYSRLGLEKLK